MKRPLVSIVMGSYSDLPTVEEARKVLKEFKVPYETRILSAHRSPEDVSDFAQLADRRGINVIIAAAGGAAHLAGVIAAHTTLPVIGIPIESKYLKGIDSLFSTVQMPGGVPVACVAIGKSGAKNAGLLACQILALSNGAVRKKLEIYKKKLAKAVRKKDRKIRSSGRRK